MNTCTHTEIRDVSTDRHTLLPFRKAFTPGSPGESNRRGSSGAVLKLSPKPFFQTTNRFSSSTLLGWKTWNSVFLSPPSLPSPFLSYPPSFRVCVSLFDGLVSALCFPLSLHSAVQRRHGPEAGHQEWERHQGGVRAQGETAACSQRHFSILTFTSAASWALNPAWCTDISYVMKFVVISIMKCLLPIPIFSSGSTFAVD